MSDFFKSALGYISGSTNSRDENDFIGQSVELGSQKLRVKRKIAEGGFAVVFVAQDNATGKEYALKRLLANDKEKTDAVLQEIKFLKKLTGHPNIVQFAAAAAIGKDQTDHGQSEYLLLMELCTGGQVVDILTDREAPLPCNTVLQIFYQTCKAVQHLHKQSPPIIHRDLKVENLLISTNGYVKLCDFGSATTETHYPDTTWTAMRRSLVEDEITKNTTPMYRTPEMLDLYQNFPINEALDIWALGCVLYMLCYGVHPYEDSAKLRIINGNYTIPENDTQYTVFHDLIMGMFRVNPVERPNINDVVDRLHEIGAARNISMKDPLPSACLQNSQPQSVFQSSPSREPPVQQQQQQQQQQNYDSGAGSLFSSLKIGAGNLMKNVKDASAKVVETVSAMNKSDIDISYITSRVAVMSYPAEGVESAVKNHIDDVRTYLESKHRNCYAIYNLSQRQYRTVKFENRVSDCGWPPRKAPSLANLFAICKNMHLWLRQNPKNVCVVHCLDGKATSATVVGAFLVFCRLFDNPQQSLNIFSNKRCPPGVCPSQQRYIQYISGMVAEEPVRPHTRPVIFNSITLAPVPLFNKMKNGCTPFVEVYAGEDRILTTSQEYEKMCGFSESEGRATIPLNVSASGDITICVFHARSTFGGKIQGKITSIKMFQLQLHTGFVNPDRTGIKFTLFDLDQLDTTDKYPERFAVMLNVTVSAKERPPESKFPWDKFEVAKLSPRILFSSKDEIQETVADFGISERGKARISRSSSVSSNESPKHIPSESSVKSTEPIEEVQPKQSQPDTAKPKSQPSVPTANFFDTLDWDQPSNVGSESVLQETKQPTEAEESLLDNLSDDEDDFAALTQGRIGVSDKPVQKSAETSNDLFTIDSDNQDKSSSQTIGNKTEQSQTNADVDFFNMNGTNGDTLANDIDLMHIPKAPSNIDLLEGTADFGSGGMDMFTVGNDQGTFDPFQQSQPQQQRVPPVQVSAPKTDEFSLFDPFGTSDDGNAAGTSTAKQEPAASDGADLMGSWGTFMSNSQNSSPNISRNNSSSNLQAGGGNFASGGSFQGLGGAGVPRTASGTFQGMGGGNIPRNNSGSSQGANLGNIPRNNSTGTFPQPMAGGGGGTGGKTAKADPFADLGGFGAPSNNAAKTSQQQQKPQQQQQQKPPMGSGYRGGMQWQQQQQPAGRVPSPTSQPTQQKSGRANYHQGSAFTDRNDSSKKTFGPKPKMGAATFDDLMPEGSNFTKKEDGPKTIGEMKKKIRKEEMDPIKLKVFEWANGKENNIRALLCSLHTVIWEDEKRWKPCGMHDLVTADQVKKMYRRAVLSVHPDKLTDSPHLELARAVFIELNDGWAKFEDEGMKSLY